MFFSPKNNHRNIHFKYCKASKPFINSIRQMTHSLQVPSRIEAQRTAQGQGGGPRRIFRTLPSVSATFCMITDSVECLQLLEAKYLEFNLVILHLQYLGSTRQSYKLQLVPYILQNSIDVLRLCSNTKLGDLNSLLVYLYLYSLAQGT